MSGRTWWVVLGGAVVGLIATLILWPTAPPPEPGSSGPTTATSRAEAPAGDARGPRTQARAARPGERVGDPDRGRRGPPPEPRRTSPPSAWGDGGAAPVTAGVPVGIRELHQAFEGWMASPDNRDAEASSLGVECRPPVCLIRARFDGLRDPTFFDRAEAWMRAQPALGHVIAFPHLIDASERRVWYFWNPFEHGTAEHHEYNLEAVEWIKEELEELPIHYPIHQ